MSQTLNKIFTELRFNKQKLKDFFVVDLLGMKAPEIIERRPGTQRHRKRAVG
jgi:hypothetical protein